MINNTNICPFNFEKFTSLNSKVNDIEASLILSRIAYHQKLSTFAKDGKTWAILTRRQIAGWFGFSVDKTDKLINLLISKGLMSKKSVLWYGVKKLIFTIDDKTEYPSVNFNLFENLVKQAGSVRSALLFSHISFRFANSIIQHDNDTWCCINKDTLANWSNTSIRTVDAILKKLINKGLINKRLFSWNNKSQTHFNIPSDIIKIFEKYWEQVKITTQNTTLAKKNNTTLPPAISNSFGNLVKLKPVNQHFCRSQQAKKPLSIIENTNIKKNNNNTCAINFYDSGLKVIGNKLTHRQIQYLRGTISKIKLKHNLKISNPIEFEEWVKFSILQKSQRKGITNFQHAVSKFMKIIADNKYNMPIGFSKYSEYGVKAMKHKRDKGQCWQELKKQETQRTNKIDFNNFLQTKNNYTEQALDVAKKIVELSKIEIKSTTENAVYNMLDGFNNDIKGLVEKGADQGIIKEYLQNNINNIHKAA
ncbi:MAG: hypothetical protein HRT87_01670 [Legionellales bacterium]|nr:hypothetical protein [Legionellales bacterium]